MKKNKFLKKIMWIFVLLCTSATAFSQTQVSGTIINDANEPIMGVSVVIKGTRSGTVTDFDGKYSLQVPNSTTTLVFSFVGFKSQEAQVGTKSEINITLRQDAQTLDEFVVVAYGAQRKSHLTGAVASLKMDGLDEVPVTRIEQALQGKIAGVQINNHSSEAGVASEIRVRGMGSISASINPLIVIDGFPMPEGSDGLSMLNMSDVESIEVLKDAASAALYGSRAGGGVILVTTKSGDSSKTNYNFKMYNGIKTALKMPDMLTTKEYISLLYSEAALRQRDPAVDGQTIRFNEITDLEKTAYLIMNNLTDGETDWVSEAMRNFAYIQNYQLSVSGGDKGLRYYVSGNYSSEEGIMKKSKYDKYTLRAKTDINLTEKVTLGINLSPTFSRQERPGADLTDYLRYPSWFPVRHNEATAALTGMNVGDYAHPLDFNSVTISGMGYDNEIWNFTNQNAWGATTNNAVAIQKKTDVITDEYKLQGSMYLTIDFTPDLQFRTSNGFYAAYKEFNRKEQTGTGANDNKSVNRLLRQMILQTDLLTENTLNYKKVWGDHDFGALIGYTAQKTSYKFNQMVGTGFSDDKYLSFNLAGQILLDAPGVQGTTSNYYSDALMSALGRLDYAYQGKYIFSASFRADGSSKFAEGHKWATFPAGSVGWRASEEDFIKNINWLTNLKLRASYGLTGNNNIPQYAYMNAVSTNNYVLGTGNGSLASGMTPDYGSLGNPEITWEQTAEANYGLDFGLFNNRLSIALEYYNSNTKQMLLEQPSMLITGQSRAWNNIGTVNNKGFEIELTTANIIHPQFTWRTTANLSTNKNTLVNYGDKKISDILGERGEIYRAEVGKPSIQFYGYKTDGVYTTLEEVEAAKNRTVNGERFIYSAVTEPTLGGIKIVDNGDDNLLNGDDRVVLGNPFPDFTWGITNTFTYRDFDFSFMIQGVQGIDLINGNPNYTEHMRYNKAYVNNRYVSPMFPGDGKTVYSTNTPGATLLLTDYVIEDGSYAALRDISLGYTIPKKLSNSLRISNLRAYFSGQNLLYFMAPGYRGINPEARRTVNQYSSPLVAGYQRGAFPLNRVFTLGIDISF